MRLLALLRCHLLSAALTAASLLAANVPLPDQSAVTDLSYFREECTSAASTILLLQRSDKPAEATRLHTALWERYDAEVFARRAAAADLSLATVNPWLPPAERAAAAERLACAAADLAELATFTMPDPATRDQFLAAAGLPVTEQDKQRARIHLTLQKFRNGVAMNQLTNRELAERRREVVARLERQAAAGEALEAAITDARDLPLASEAVRSLASNFSDPGAIATFYQLTSESLALEATLTRLIASDPANLVFWLARAQARFALGWRPAAIIDLTIASNFKADDPGVLALRDQIRAVPSQVASLWQEHVAPDSAQILSVSRRARAALGKGPEELSPALERTARAALRNRARRLYACSFLNKPETFQAALRFTDENNALGPGLFPLLSPTLSQQFQAERAAAGTDGLAVFAIHHRYAPLFATTEAFWQLHTSLFLAASQPAGARAALAVAETQFPSAAWIQQARSRLDPVKPLPAAEKK